ncbi:hypothetical protein AAG906_041236 [Vitis piasezkii]
MAIVSSHSWSLFLETRRKSSSLSHIKLNKTSEEAIPTLHCLVSRGQDSPSVGFDILGPRGLDCSIFEGGVTSSPPRCRYATRRPPTSPPLEKLQALESPLDIHSLILGPLPILSVLPASHRKPLSRGLWSPRRPLRAIQIQPELPDSFGPLRYHLEYLMTPKDPTTIHFSIDGRQGILDARHVARLHIFHTSDSCPIGVSVIHVQLVLLE